MLIGIQYIFEIISFLVAVLSYRRLKGSFMVWFIPFLGAVVIIETAANVMYYTFGIPPVAVYNVATLFYSSFYTYAFIALAESKKHKQALFWINLGYVLVYTIYVTLAGQWNTRLNKDLVVAGFIEMVVFSCLFFYQCLRDDETLDSKYRSGLWVAAGVLIFYSGFSICYSLIKYIAEHDLRIFGERLYSIIPRYLSVVLYSCLSISLLVWKKPVKSS